MLNKAQALGRVGRGTRGELISPSSPVNSRSLHQLLDSLEKLNNVADSIFGNIKTRVRSSDMTPPYSRLFRLSYLVKDIRRKIGPDLKEFGQATFNLPKTWGLSYLTRNENRKHREWRGSYYVWGGGRCELTSW